MSDELTNGTNVTPEEQQGAPAAEPQNTDTTAEHMIPKSRFDEVNKELKALRKQAEDAQKAREKAEAESAAEQGKYRELWEAEQKKVADYEAKVKALEMSQIRAKIAAEFELPAALADRLAGEDEEELRADAERLAELLQPGKPKPPNLDNGAGSGQRAGGKNIRLTQEEIAMANKMNISLEDYAKNKTKL